MIGEQNLYWANPKSQWGHEFRARRDGNVYWRNIASIDPSQWGREFRARRDCDMIPYEVVVRRESQWGREFRARRDEYKPSETRLPVK